MYKDLALWSRQSEWEEKKKKNGDSVSTGHYEQVSCPDFLLFAFVFHGAVGHTLLVEAYLEVKGP